MPDKPKPPQINTTHGLDRRDLLKRALGLGILAAGTTDAGARDAAPDIQGSVISRENALPGTTDWMLTKTHLDPATRYRSPRIEGYCSATSLRAEDTASRPSLKRATSSASWMPRMSNQCG